MKKNLLVISSLLSCLLAPVQADINHSGTVSIIRNYAASADPTITESWTWFQIAGLTGASGCPSYDEGMGDLAYIALPDSEDFMESMVLSAYLSGQPIDIVVDENNFYQSMCRIKQVTLSMPGPAIFGEFDPYWDNVVFSSHFEGVDGAANFVDKSLDARSINVFGDSHFDTSQAKFGDSSVYFDGSSDYLSIPASSVFVPTSDFTAEFWFRVDSFSNKNPIWLVHARPISSGSNANSFGLYLSGDSTIGYGLVGFIFDQNSVSTASPIDSADRTILEDTWYHAAFVRQNDTITAYLDGEVVGTFDASSIVLNSISSGSDLLMGDGPGSNRSLTGWIDDVRITDGVARYTSTFIPPIAQNPDGSGSNP